MDDTSEPPISFTLKDVERIRMAARVWLAMPLEDAEALEELADRIEARLPAR